MKVKFHLPNFAQHFKFNLVFISMMEACPKYFREGVEIASVFGVFPPSMWNGGRTQGGTCNDNFISGVTKAFNEKGIPLRFTFTNPMLEEKHLKDKFCNKVLKTANNGLNEVIVVSPLLEDYIRKNYPEYKITSSTCKRLSSIEALNEELKKDYNLVVMDYDLNNRFDLLEQVEDKERCEILINACCVPECPNRVNHYKSIGLQQIAYCEHLAKYPNRPFNAESSVEPQYRALLNCPTMDLNPFEIRKHRTHITPDDIWEKYVPMGFHHFKIEGRTASAITLLEHYLYYMVKPEYRDEARFIMITNLKDNGVIKY